MDAAKAELLRTLGRLVRGLSTLFWTLPAGLIIYVETARANWLDFAGDAAFVPAMAVGVLFWHSLRQMRDFQKQERIWHQALNRAELLAVVIAGLAPCFFLVAPVSLHFLLYRVRGDLCLFRFAVPDADQRGFAASVRDAAGREFARGDKNVHLIQPCFVPGRFFWAGRFSGVETGGDTASLYRQDGGGGQPARLVAGAVPEPDAAGHDHGHLMEDQGSHFPEHLRGGTVMASVCKLESDAHKTAKTIVNSSMPATIFREFSLRSLTNSRTADLPCTH
jgi:hypothetical protein